MQELVELTTGVSSISLWTKFADFHGLLAMFSLILFGAAIILYFLSTKASTAVPWLKKVLFSLFANLVLLDIAGLVVYVPYRSSAGPRTILKASQETAWLHNIVFEHKEFLAFAPPILILTAAIIVSKLSGSFADESKNKWLRKSVIFSILVSLIYVLIVAAEAVLVTKAAPV